MTGQARPDPHHAGAQKVFFICFTDPVAGALEQIKATLPEHKAWAAQTEAAGHFFAAGPLLSDEFTYTGSGMMILRVKTREEAEAIAATDPMHAKNLRHYRIVPWQLNEGTLALDLRWSNGTLSFS